MVGGWDGELEAGGRRQAGARETAAHCWLAVMEADVFVYVCLSQVCIFRLCVNSVFILIQTACLELWDLLTYLITLEAITFSTILLPVCVSVCSFQDASFYLNPFFLPLLMFFSCLLTPLPFLTSPLLPPLWYKLTILNPFFHFHAAVGSSSLTGIFSGWNKKTKAGCVYVSTGGIFKQVSAWFSIMLSQWPLSFLFLILISFSFLSPCPRCHDKNLYHSPIMASFRGACDEEGNLACLSLRKEPVFISLWGGISSSPASFQSGMWTPSKQNTTKEKTSIIQKL